LKPQIEIERINLGKIIWIVVAFLAGAFLPLQGGFNALLGKEARNPMYASCFPSSSELS
jgi:uncharacterized membrane protein YdcZ (DUF606 family)